MGDWEGAIDTDEGRAFHRTVGEHRAWSNSGGWCYPTDLCEWCHGQRGDEQVWLPADGTPEHEALVKRLTDSGDVQQVFDWYLNGGEHRRSVDDWCETCSYPDGPVYHDPWPETSEIDVVRVVLLALREAP